MATKKTPVTDDDALAMPASDADFDQAIDDLRGVLKSDSDGTLPDLGGDFGSDLGGDFGAGSSDAPGMASFDSDFGGGSPSMDTGSFGDTSFGGGFSDTGGQTAGLGSALNANLDLIMDIPIDVQIVLGSSRMQVSGLMNLEEGAIIALDKKIGEPVEIMVNGRRIAKGEITVLENDDTRFGVKLIEVMSTKTS
ncbi:flagellar motor switch protein FliN [Agrobacterium sp. a22-2]|uniref:flagellar motor switch protein FliN n=1 Tax=Agrobacterium sp. a22-2 TaxID=2283840 RepID=UPI0014457534|nr:flagellar motor switch protein FliN [Agrobacterium sp. a22-2]NKN34841.1 flagellar motor switch protein FliN [Agrobacterium sp. a22-2]